MFARKGTLIPITHTAVLEKIFLVWAWVLQGTLDFDFYSFFTVVFFNGLIISVSHLFMFFKFWICVLSFRSIDTSNSPRFVNLSTYYVLIAFAVIKPIVQLTYCIFFTSNVLELCLIFKTSLPSIYSGNYNILQTPKKFVL